MVLVRADILAKDAQRYHYAVGAFNVTTIGMVQGVIAAAEANQAPVILQFGERQARFVPLATIAPILIAAAKSATVPVAVHLDHGLSFETVMQALRLGFSSVMIDASSQSIAANQAVTAAVVRVAHALNVSVEAELGPMQREGGPDAVDYAGLDATYTDPGVVADFVAATGLDMLAVAYGTVHGVYTQTPRLNYDRLAEIAQQTHVPLVVHGGSGLSDGDYRRSIAGGIAKINYFSTMAKNVTDAIRDRLNQPENQGVFVSELALWERDLVAEEVAARLAVFGGQGRGPEVLRMMR
ncbi:class II fructose-bisphosphate aldolase [Lacticaseibacillus kribbianus]|uniref:class II fructose-bisphosphate aldolase n=1 Tax=Lacticaseibacillus kribbianus TaxID=2926292 RepID=UPI001CD7AA26|nr:class II fructose-bisphosphate aldolase [Lacticaseibacillus kribbianus]